MELAIGQYLSLGTVGAWTALCPLARGNLINKPFLQGCFLGDTGSLGTQPFFSREAGGGRTRVVTQRNRDVKENVSLHFTDLRLKFLFAQSQVNLISRNFTKERN